MATSSVNEQDALAQVMRADEEEARRAFWWRLMPTIDRARALGLARIDPARAGHALETFTIQERAMIHGAVQSHIGRMEILMLCTGIVIERPPVDHLGALTRQAELEQQQEQAARRRSEFTRLQQEQEQEQGRAPRKSRQQQRKQQQQQQQEHQAQDDALDAGRGLLH